MKPVAKLLIIDGLKDSVHQVAGRTRGPSLHILQFSPLVLKKCFVFLSFLNVVLPFVFYHPLQPLYPGFEGGYQQ
jgi:hypothetical protein